MNVQLIHIKAYHLNNHILIGCVCLTLQWHWCLNYTSWPRRKGMKLFVVLNASMTLTRTEGSSMQTTKVRTVHRWRQWSVNQNETTENAYMCDSRNRRGRKSHSAQQFVYPWCTPLQALKTLLLVPTFSTNKTSLPSSNNTWRVCENHQLNIVLRSIIVFLAVHGGNRDPTVYCLHNSILPRRLLILIIIKGLLVVPWRQSYESIINK
jgi:hypothetical protein